MDQKAIHAYFSGVVQGVGFRFTARNLARRHRVRGWVKNLADGRVELVVQGPKNEVDKFLVDLNQEFKMQISQRSIEDVSSIQGSNEFEINF